MFDFNPVQILASIPAIIIVFSVFGYAEARVATWLGDPTPRMAGRLTLSPMAHLDLFGTICIILIGFGWPKEMAINPSFFKDPRRDMTLLAFSGPIAGLVTGFIFTFIYILLSMGNLVQSQGLFMVLQYIISYSIGISLFCLIPFPPLPGFNIILPWLPVEWQMRYYQLGLLNLLFFIILINTPIISMIIIPLQHTIFKMYFTVIGIILGM
ncbi:site-2 protease family protein [Veillonella rodentium]|uniref:Zn-dependent proteases n=1 Tax=Veillonella rodentium TaxID=248315 RepID=A0A239ZXS8_9FIRM|nr:site-2 protease family protein [Veillonella rodentium]SNV76032.1 Zn-dependent proteases [Veillonella rodentium]